MSSSKSTYLPIFGGAINSFSEFLKKIKKELYSSNGSGLNEKVILSLIHNYGSEYKEVTKYIDEKPELSKTLGNSSVLKAEVIHAVKEEMAQKLSDVVLRRTDLGTAEYPGKETLRDCANLIASELNWNDKRVDEELAQVEKFYENHASIKNYN